MRAAILYFTVNGSTEKAAAVLSGVLRHKGFQTVVTRVSDRLDLEPYDHIFIGVPVYYTRLSESFKSFVRQRKSSFDGKKVYFFVTCLGGRLFECHHLDPRVHVGVHLDVKCLTSRKRGAWWERRLVLNRYEEQIVRLGVPFRSLGIFRGTIRVKNQGVIGLLYLWIMRRFFRDLKDQQPVSPYSLELWADTLFPPADLQALTDPVIDKEASEESLEEALGELGFEVNPC